MTAAEPGREGIGGRAVAVIEAAWPGVPGSRFGVGMHANIVTASVMALVNAAARFEGDMIQTRA